MAQAGYLSTVYVGGTPVSTTNVVLTKMAADATKGIPADSWFRVVDPTRRVVDPSVAVLVEVDADGGGAGGYATAAATTYALDLLAGIVKFTPPLATVATVRISYTYVPLLPLIGAYEASMSWTNEDLDATPFNTAGTRTRFLGMQDAEATVSSWELMDTDHDAGAGTVKLENVLLNRTQCILDFNPGGGASTDRYRMWAMCTSGEDAAAVADMLKSTVTFKQVVRQHTGRQEWTGLSVFAG